MGNTWSKCADHPVTKFVEGLPVVGYAVSAAHGIAGDSQRAKRAAAKCSNSTITMGGAFVGGILGAAGGPAGVAMGAGLGASMASALGQTAEAGINETIQDKSLRTASGGWDKFGERWKNGDAIMEICIAGVGSAISAGVGAKFMANTKNAIVGPVSRNAAKLGKLGRRPGGVPKAFLHQGAGKAANALGLHGAKRYLFKKGITAFVGAAAAAPAKLALQAGRNVIAPGSSGKPEHVSKVRLNKQTGKVEFVDPRDFAIQMSIGANRIEQTWRVHEDACQYAGANWEVMETFRGMPVEEAWDYAMSHECYLWFYCKNNGVVLDIKSLGGRQTFQTGDICFLYGKGPGMGGSGMWLGGAPGIDFYECMAENELPPQPKITLSDGGRFSVPHEGKSLAWKQHADAAQFAGANWDIKHVMHGTNDVQALNYALKTQCYLWFFVNRERLVLDVKGKGRMTFQKGDAVFLGGKGPALGGSGMWCGAAKGCDYYECIGVIQASSPDSAVQVANFGGKETTWKKHPNAAQYAEANWSIKAVKQMTEADAMVWALMNNCYLWFYCGGQQFALNVKDKGMMRFGTGTAVFLGGKGRALNGSGMWCGSAPGATYYECTKERVLGKELFLKAMSK